MNKNAKAVIKEYEKKMAEYLAKVKKYEADMKLFRRQEKSYIRAMEGRVRVVLRVGPYRDEDVFDAIVTEKVYRKLVAAIGKHHVAVVKPCEPREPDKPSLYVSSGSNDIPF